MGQLRTAGLTLKVDGSEGFQQKLDNATKAISRNSAEVKLLEATYGRSSTSMEYLSQRSQLLSQRLEQQQQKTDTLKQARDQYAASEGAEQDKLEKLDMQILKSQTAEADLARQIKECNAEIDRQAQQAAETAQQQERLGEAGDNAADGQKALGDAASEAAADMDAAGKAADGYVKKIESIGAAVEKAGKTATKFLTMPIMGMGTAAVKYGLDFEDAIYEVATLPGVLAGTVEEQNAQLEQYAKQLLAASDRSYTAASEVTSAMYDAVSAGVAVEDSVHWAERAAMAGKAGRTDAATVVSGASSVYNAWGKMASGGLDHILDVMMTAQNRGKTTVGDLAGSIGQVAGLAPQLGVAMEEVFASVAAMTLGGTETSSAFTGLRGVLSAILKPTAEASEKAAELGLKFDAAALQAKGLTGFLADVADKTNNDSEALGVLFGNVNGLNAVMQLGGSAAATYADILQEMQTAAGVLDQAFETRTSSRAMQLSGSLNELKNRGIELAENLYPVVDVVTGLIGGVSNVVGSMDAGGQKALVTVLGLTAAVGPATTAAGKLMKNFGSLRSMMASPWSWAALGAAGIGALVYQLTGAETSTDRMRKAAEDIRIEANPESVSRMRQTIQSVISLVEKEHYVTAQLNWSIEGDTIQEELTSIFDAALADSKLNLSEYNSLLAILRGDIGSEITDAKQDPLTAALADELQGAVDEFNALLELVYRQGGTATEQEIADLETALERVKALRAELLGAYTEADAAQMSVYAKNADLVKQGYGDENMLAEAVGLVMGEYQIAVAGNDQAREKASRQLQERLLNAETDAEKQRAQESYEMDIARLDRSDAEAAAQRDAEMVDLWKGWMNKGDNRDIAGQLEQYGMVVDLMSAMLADARTGSSDNALAERLTPDKVQALEGLGLLNAAGEVEWSNPTQFDLDALYGQLESLATSIEKELGAAFEGGENPIQTLLETWVAADFDPAAMDTTQLSGSLAGYLRLCLFQEGGVDAIGSEAIEAIGSGIEGALPATVREADSAAGGVGDALAGIPSPYQAGYGAVSDIRRGMMDAAAAAYLTGHSIASEIGDSLSVITPGEGLSYSYGGSAPRGGGSGTSIDNSVNVTVQNARMTSATDVQAMSEQLGAINRHKMAGYGVVDE